MQGSSNGFRQTYSIEEITHGDEKYINTTDDNTLTDVIRNNIALNNYACYAHFLAGVRVWNVR